MRVSAETSRPLGVTRRRLEFNKKLHLKEIRFEAVNRIHVAQISAGLCEHGNDLSFSVNAENTLTTAGQTFQVRCSTMQLAV